MFFKKWTLAVILALCMVFAVSALAETNDVVEPESLDGIWLVTIYAPLLDPVEVEIDILMSNLFNGVVTEIGGTRTGTLSKFFIFVSWDLESRFTLVFRGIALGRVMFGRCGINGITPGTYWVARKM